MKQNHHILLGFMLFFLVVGYIILGHAKMADAGFMDEIGAAVKKGIDSGLGIKSSETPTQSPITGKLTPYDESIAFVKQYPRIAVTVLKTPPEHAKLYLPTAGGGGYPDACYLLKARLWQNAKKYEDTPEFKWCSPGDIAYGVSMESYAHWSSGIPVLSSASVDGSTGLKRTAGPVPPKTPFPTDIKHVKFFRTGSVGGILDSTLDLIMMGSLAYNAGIDPSTKDRRLWFVEFTEAVH